MNVHGPPLQWESYLRMHAEGTIFFQTWAWPWTIFSVYMHGGGGGGGGWDSKEHEYSLPSGTIISRYLTYSTKRMYKLTFGVCAGEVGNILCVWGLRHMITINLSPYKSGFGGGGQH